MYAELTPGQISGFAVDAVKSVFWEPLAVYSEINENPDIANGYTERFCPGWENYSIITEKVCEVALSRGLRQVPVNEANQLV